MASSPPITWRNVNAPSSGGAADLFGQAQESFDGAIKAARDTKDGFEKGRTDRNTQAFMSQLQQYGSSEELAAAQESGALADLRGQFGSMVDQDKVSADAVTDRVTNLQGRETAQYDRDQMLTERAEKPIFDRINANIADIDLGQSREALEKGRGEFEDGIRNSGLQPASQAKAMANYDSRVKASYMDKRNEEGYAETLTNRANKKEDRAHKLSERDRIEEERLAAKELDRLTGMTASDFASKRQGYDEQRTQIATDLGMTITNGAPNVKDATPEQRAELKKRTADMEGVNQSRTVKAYADKLNAMGVTGEQYTTRMGELKSRLKTQNALGEPEALQLQKRVDSAQKKADTEEAYANEDFKRASGANGFVALAGQDPNVVGASIIKSINDESFGADAAYWWDNSSATNRENITNSVSDALAGNITGPDGTKLSASEGMVRQAFTAAFQSDDPAGTFDDILEGIMLKPENIQQASDAETMVDEHRKNLASIENRRVLSSELYTLQARQSSGLPTQTQREFNDTIDRTITANMDKKEQEAVIRAAGKEARAKAKKEKEAEDAAEVKADKEAKAAENLNKKLNPKPVVDGSADAGISGNNAQTLQSRVIANSRQEGQTNYTNSLNESEATLNDLISNNELSNLGKNEKAAFLIQFGDYLRDMKPETIKKLSDQIGANVIKEALEDPTKTSESLRQTAMKLLDFSN